eukprot:3557619-Rhodomonas_salina.2
MLGSTVVVALGVVSSLADDGIASTAYGENDAVSAHTTPVARSTAFCIPAGKSLGAHDRVLAPYLPLAKKGGRCGWAPVDLEHARAEVDRAVERERYLDRRVEGHSLRPVVDHFSADSSPWVKG